MIFRALTLQLMNNMGGDEDLDLDGPDDVRLLYFLLISNNKVVVTTRTTV